VLGDAHGRPEVAVFIVFGRYLVNRLVLWPLEVVATADAVADGDLGARTGRERATSPPRRAAQTA